MPVALKMPLISVSICDVYEASGRILCKETGENIEVQLKVAGRFTVAGEPGLTLHLGKVCGEDDVIRIEVMQTLDITPESPKSDSAPPTPRWGATVEHPENAQRKPSAPLLKLLGFTEIPLQGLASSLQLISSKSWEGMLSLRRDSAFCWTPFETVAGMPKIRVRLIFGEINPLSAGEHAESELPTPVEFVGNMLHVEECEFVPAPSRCIKHKEDDVEFVPTPVQSMKGKPMGGESADRKCCGPELICQKLQARNEVVSQSMNELPLPFCPRCSQRLKFTTDYPAHYPPGGVRCHVCGHSVAIYGGFFLCPANSNCRFDMCWECHERTHGEKIPQKCPQDHDLILFQTPNANFICDKCDIGVPQGAYVHQCRICNYDLCQSCIHHKDKVTSEPAGRATCPQGHLLEALPVAHIKSNVREEASTKPGERTLLITRTHTVCDICELQLTPGSNTHSCRMCNYDVCQKCAALPPGSRVTGSISTTNLPFPHGSAHYQGFLYHPLLSSWKLHMNLVVTRQVGQADFVGQWTAMGQMEDIIIKMTGETFTMFNPQGGQTTVLQGTVDSLGILAGIVEQNGDKRGSFELHPLASKNTAQSESNGV
eukprot:gnl/MRDRNA2_/MRDRNA2_89289_c0_seq1.p1 gnl/MRDRNA2_/MRDRNA2_89289_c0~~gnl/MRDRNA2_/MRDRNA2_89289_c0_seq1.p1  ORF type:complete len:611 (-),score=62.88 gnl/MRDRNA2_/MRDRNA2_89289_c0_seq1:128-1924(-)